MSSESSDLVRPHLPSPIGSHLSDSDQSEIIRLPARPSSRLSHSSSSSVERDTKEPPLRMRLPFKFAVNEDRFLNDLPTPIPR
jgi:hypothetical protein